MTGVQRSVYYQGAWYDVRARIITIWQGAEITPDSGAKHVLRGDRP